MMIQNLLCTCVTKLNVIYASITGSLGNIKMHLVDIPCLHLCKNVKQGRALSRKLKAISNEHFWLRFKHLFIRCMSKKELLSISWSLHTGCEPNYRFVCIQQSQYSFELHGNMLLMHANGSVCQLAWQQRKDTECVQRHGVSFISQIIKKIGIFLVNPI